jgi:transcriptional regulator with XRE-family HTH domain
MDTLNRQLGQRIQEARRVKGWTQEDLAHHANLDFSYINQLENGKRNPSLATIHKIAIALEVSVKDLIPG